MLRCRAALLAVLALVAIIGCNSEKVPNNGSDQGASYVHFIIPNGAGSGVDTTARTVGNALVSAGLLEKSSFQNIPGGGGSKATAHLIETSKRQPNSILITSTPSIIRALQGVFPHTYKDLTPVASIIGDYGAVVVRSDSDFETWEDVLSVFRKDPKSLRVAGGSVRGGMDHLIIASAIKAAGELPEDIRYVSYDGGGKAFVSLLSGETNILSTGLGEALGRYQQGQIRILAVAADKKLTKFPAIPTFRELGYDVVFVNWRGFFAAPDTSTEFIQSYVAILSRMYDTDEWARAREANGWSDLFRTEEKFSEFLLQQEMEIASLMEDVGVANVAN